MPGLYVLLIAFCIAFLSTPLVRYVARLLQIVDQPNNRKVHQTPIPLLGGVSIAVAIGLTAVTVILFGGQDGIHPALKVSTLVPILCGGVMVFSVGLWDDVQTLPVWVKLLVQALAAAVAVGYGIRVDHVSLFGGSGFELGMWAVPLSFFWILGITNAFNLLDGLDGLASGLAIIIAGANALFFFSLGENQSMLLLLILLGALVGFLPYNFNPATIFLGDCGSLVLGYLLSVTAISGTQNSMTSLAVVIPLLLFGLPIADTLLSMIRRLVASVKLLRQSEAPLPNPLGCIKAMFQADRRHIHHRLLALGFSHRHAVLILYGISLSLASLALLSALAQYRNAGMILIAVGVAAYAGIRRLGYDEVEFVQTTRMLRWYEQARINRRMTRGLIHAILVATAYWGAFVLKYDHLASEGLDAWYLRVFPINLVVHLVFFYLMGLHRGVWRSLGMRDLIFVGGAILSANALSYILALLNVPPAGVQSFFLIDTLLLGCLILSVWGTYHILSSIRSLSISAGRETLIFDAGPRGQSILREIQQNPDCGLRPIGFLDNNRALHGHTVNRVPVLGSVSDFRTIVGRRQVSCLILPEKQLSELNLRWVTNLCKARDIDLIQSNLSLPVLAPESYEKAS